MFPKAHKNWAVASADGTAASSSASGSGGATTMSNLNTRDEKRAYPRKSFGDELEDICLPFDMENKSARQWAREVGATVYRGDDGRVIAVNAEGFVYDPVAGFNGNVFINDYKKTITVNFQKVD